MICIKLEEIWLHNSRIVCRLVEIKKSIRNTDGDLSDVLLRLKVRVGANYVPKFEYLVDDGYRLLWVSFNCTIHGFESFM